MTERGKRHLAEILGEIAGQATAHSGDPWPAVRERLGGAPRPWRRRLLPRNRAGWVIVALVAALFGTAAYATSTSEKTVTDVRVEEAVLRKSPGLDQVVVRVRATGRADLPWCYLTQGSSIRETRWFDDDLTEQRTFGDVAVFTFFEDASPSGEPVDPGRTPFTAWCSAGTSPGGDGPGVRQDEAHIAGTPEEQLPPEDREFVRKDMEFQQITPPASTLSSDGRAVEGQFGTYCWSPGRRDEDENALWCWNEQEQGGIPGEDKALKILPGSAPTFDFGGEARPDRTGAGAFPIAYGRLTGGAPTELRVGEDGRVPIPEDMRAGEYVLGVFVEGPQGEAEYSFRIEVVGRDGP